MLSFEDKKAIFLSFNLEEKQISNGRVSFIYPKSKQRGQVLATQLHPSGNGYVIGKYMSEETIKKNEYKVDSRGWISIRDFSRDALVKVISEARKSMFRIEDADEKEDTFVKNNEESCLYHWFNFNKSLLELGLLIWKRSLRRGKLL